MCSHFNPLLQFSPWKMLLQSQPQSFVPICYLPVASEKTPCLINRIQMLIWINRKCSQPKKFVCLLESGTWNRLQEASAPSFRLITYLFRIIYLIGHYLFVVPSKSSIKANALLRGKLKLCFCTINLALAFFWVKRR